MYSEEIKLFLNFIKSVVSETTAVEVEKKQLPIIYMLAQKQGLIHMLALACKRQGLLGEDALSEELKKSIRKTLLRYEIFAAEEQQIYAQLERAKIGYVPLKGSVIRSHYKEPWLRTSNDIDVLVKETDVERAKELLQNELGYELIKNNYHDIALRSPSNIVVELHFTITENEPSMDRMLGQVWEHVHPVEEQSYRYEMEPEFLFFHVMAHMLYHFKHGGCGVRFFIDLWILQGALAIDMQKVNTWFQACEMDVFAEHVMHLAAIWFGEGMHDEVSISMQEYILNGGLYGTTQSKVMAQKANAKGEATYLFQRVFQPYRELAAAYPTLRKHPWLYPYYTICRWTKLLRVSEAKKAKEELSISKDTNADRVKALAELFQTLNI